MTFLLLVFFAVELPVLDNEIYHAVKPGLSSYKDNPEEVCISVNTVTHVWGLLAAGSSNPLGFSFGLV